MADDNKLGEAATMAAQSDVGSDPTLAATPKAGLDATLTDPAANERQATGTAVDAPLDLRAANTEEYVVIDEVARGGMGRILRARDRRHQRQVALKEILKSSDGSRARFAREALITARLQHPGIVPVYEFARWEGGEPFYVMKLVEGRPLSVVLRETETLADRLALVPKLIDAARAIAYAHEQGVIHRDLKPSNILVGDFGETVVIDWGLAKDVDSDDDDIAEPSTSSGSDLTVAGSVMGTPLYMPLEQAEGKALDARADVYALGAILYHLLSGDPPYRAETGEAILEAVRDEAPTPLGERDVAIPADLVTIVDKAMARAREDRYASGVELAAELERYTTGQLVGAHRYSTWELVRRRMRRHRGALIASAVAAVALIAVSSVLVLRIIDERNAAEKARAEAVAARQDADEQRVGAEELVDFMLEDLREKLAPIGQMGLLKDVADRAKAYAATGDPDAARTLNRRRQIAALSGNIHRGEGDMARAEESFRLELELANRAAALEKTNEAQKRVAQAHQRIAETLTALGNRQEALVELERSKIILTELGDEADVEAALGEVFAAEGMVKMIDEELPGARVAFKMAHEAIAREWEKNKDNPAAGMGMLRAQMRMADVELLSGESADALALYDKVLERIEQTAIPEGSRAFMRGRIQHKRGNALSALDKRSEARAAYEASAAVFARLSKDEPGNKLLIYFLASALAGQAHASDDTDARRLLARAIEMMQPIAAGSDEWLAHLGTLHVRLGMRLRASDKGAARRELSRGIEVLEPLEAAGKLLAIEGDANDLKDAREALAELR